MKIKAFGFTPILGWSFSRYGIFSDCKRKYYYQYYGKYDTQYKRDKIDFQADYIRELCAETDYPEFDIDGTVDAFKEWEHDKDENILGYRDQQFKSPCTGTLSPPHHTTWLEAMDDSMVTYFNVKE